MKMSRALGSCVAVLVLAGAARAGTRITDPLQDAVAQVGDLGEAPGDTLEAAARGWLRIHGGEMGLAETGAALLVDAQDGTPVRMVRFRMLPASEVAVVFGPGRRVIGCTRAPGPRPVPAAARRQPVVPPLAAPAVSCASSASPGTAESSATAASPGSAAGSATAAGPGTAAGSATATSSATAESSRTAPSSGTAPGAGTAPRARTAPGSGTAPGTGTAPGAGTAPGSGTAPSSGAGASSATAESSRTAAAAPVVGRVAVLPADGDAEGPGLGKGWPRVATQDVPLAELLPGSTLDGTHFATARLAGPRVELPGLFDPSPDVKMKSMHLAPAFLEVNAYHHATQAHAAVTAYGAGARYDAQVGRIRLIIDQTHTQSGRPLSGNAFYSSNDNALHFAADDAFPSAGDPSVIAHEMGHAVWRALVGAEPEKPVPLEELAVYEGHADAFAALVTGDPVFGHHWLGPKEERDCRNTRRHHVDAKTYQHDLGQVYSSLLYTFHALPPPAFRNLLLGSIQLAPRPVTPASLLTGLLLADAWFHASANAAAILEAARARDIPAKVD